MKRILTLLIFFAFSFCAKAQDTKIQPLKIGDRIPDFEFRNLSNSNSSMQKASSLYRDGLLIINFWDTWCIPCVREMPYLDSMQAVNGRHIHIVAVTIEAKPEVDKFLTRHPDFKHLLYSSGDTRLSEYFPHSGVPHNVWIDKNGIVRAFTSDDEINPDVVTRFLSGSYNMYMKRDTAFDFEKPLKIADTAFTYRSIFTGRKDEIGTGGVWLPDTNQSKTRFVGWNIPKITFIWAAHMRSGFTVKDYSLVEFHVKDTLSFYTLKHYNNHRDWTDESKMKAYYDFLKNNFYCYEMSFNHKINLDDFYSIMSKEVDLLFKVSAQVENRKTSCWVITKINADKLLGKSVAIKDGEIQLYNSSLIAKHQTWKQIAASLTNMFQNEPPFVDETGIAYPVDINKNFGDLSDGFTLYILKKYLNDIGLDLTRKVVDYPHLIIYDKN